MAGIGRVHGQVLSGSSYNVTGSEGAFFSGYQPLVLKFASTNNFNGDSVNGTTGVITDGPRTKAIRAVAQFGSILMVDRASNNDALTVIVDGASFNRAGLGSNANSETDFGGVIAAVENAIDDGLDFYWADNLNSDGTWDF
mgnify:CR=1 FL=1